MLRSITLRSKGNKQQTNRDGRTTIQGNEIKLIGKSLTIG